MKHIRERQKMLRRAVVLFQVSRLVGFLELLELELKLSDEEAL